MRGTYILVLFLNDDCIIKIGALGNLKFLKGYYIYIGSAMGLVGSNTMENRIKRHLSSSKKLHWHIDYLLENGNCGFYRIYLIPSRINLECLIANDIVQMSDETVIGFGSSDCSCESHLFYFRNFTGFE